jgi:hypothetical protein
MARSRRELTEEFEPYIDAVVRSGERTRIIIYVTLLVLFFVGCGIRDFAWPSWDEQRLRVMLDNSGCVTGTGPHTDDCTRLLADYADQGLIFGTPPGDKAATAAKTPEGVQRDLALKVYERRVIELMKKDLRGYSLEIPLFGVYLDGNDLWLVSGVLVALLLLILAAHIERELVNYEKAADACPNNACRDLLVMAQIFALPGEKPGRFAVMHRLFFAALYFLPAVLNLYVIRNDFTARNYAFNVRMIGANWVHVEYVLRVLSVLAVTYLCYRCWRMSTELQGFIGRLQTSRFPRKTRARAA